MPLATSDEVPSGKTSQSLTESEAAGEAASSVFEVIMEIIGSFFE